MRLAVLADETLKSELEEKITSSAIEVTWKTDLEELVADQDADLYMDLLFTNEPTRIRSLKKLLPAPVIINSVTETLAETEAPFIRINAWPGFLRRGIAEIAIAGEDQEANVKLIMENLNWSYKIVPDTAGMITPRVVAMIINEAYFALGEDVSTKAEIDTAMKLGTNYPFGPFEWCEKIGLEKIVKLLEKLGEDSRYIIADALKQEYETKFSSPAMEERE